MADLQVVELHKGQKIDCPQSWVWSVTLQLTNGVLIHPGLLRYLILVEVTRLPSLAEQRCESLPLIVWKFHADAPCACAGRLLTPGS